MRKFGIILTCGRAAMSSVTIPEVIGELDAYVVVDNASPDMTILWLAQNKHPFAALPKNVGISAGQRIGLEFAQEGDLIFTIDDDLNVPKGTITEMAEEYAKHDGLTILAPLNDSISPDCVPFVIEEKDGIQWSTHVSALRCFSYDLAKVIFNIPRDITRCEHVRNMGGKCGYITSLHITEIDPDNRRPNDEYIF